jgi:2,4'-dihydroxyacetophenone dioxygenase
MYDVEAELLKTLHIHADDLPFVEFESGIKTRLLHARPQEGLVVTQIQASPGIVGRLHRHLEPVFGFTTRGTWGHDTDYKYRPGTYVYETPGVVHRFLAGPHEPAEAIFVSHGNLEWFDPETLEVVGVATPQVMLDAYVTKCAQLGHAAPSLLS